MVPAEQVEIADGGLAALIAYHEAERNRLARELHDTEAVLRCLRQARAYDESAALAAAAIDRARAAVACSRQSS